MSIFCYTKLDFNNCFTNFQLTDLYLRTLTAMKAESGLLRRDITAGRATGRLQSSHMISARSVVHRAIYFTIVLIWACVTSEGFPRHANTIDSQPEIWDFPTFHSMEKLGDIHISGDSIDLRINPNSTCNWDSCFYCTSSIRQPASKKGTPKVCEINSNVKNASCFLDSTLTCLTLQELRNYSLRRRLKIRLHDKCCVFAQMSTCDNGGHSMCYTGPEPVCQCRDGWKGDRCREQATQPVRCRCYKSGHKFCNQENMVDCDNAHGNWSQCQKYGDDAGEALNCICQNSNPENGEDEQSLRKEEYDKAIACPWPSSSPVINPINNIIIRTFLDDDGQRVLSPDYSEESRKERKG